MLCFDHPETTILIKAVPTHETTTFQLNLSSQWNKRLAFGTLTSLILDNLARFLAEFDYILSVLRFLFASGWPSWNDKANLLSALLDVASCVLHEFFEDCRFI